MTKRDASILAVAAVGLWLGFREEVLGPVLVLWRAGIAVVTEVLVHWAGMAASRQGSVLYHPGGVALEISRGCTGLVPAVLLAIAIALYPSNLGRKLAGAAAGILLLLALNLVRLVHLYYLAVHQPQWFRLAHEVVWEGIIILAVLGVWLRWTARDPLAGTSTGPHLAPPHRP